MRKNEKQTAKLLKFSHRFKSTWAEIPWQLFKA